MKADALQGERLAAGDIGPSPLQASPFAGWVFVGLAAATPLVAFFGNLGFALLAAFAGLLLLPLAATPRAPWPLLTLLAAALAWAVVSMTWSPFHPPPPTSLKAAGQVTGLKLALQLLLYGALAAAASRVASDAANRATRLLAYGMAALVALLLVEALDGQALYTAVRSAAGHASPRPDWAKRDIARAVYVLALLFWPMALTLSRRRGQAAGAALFVATAVAGVALGVDSPLAALALSALAVLGVSTLGRVAIVGAGALSVAYLAFAPIAVALAGPMAAGHAAAGGVAKASWGARLEIWRFVEGLIAQHPVRGRGLDASRAFPGAIPLHPHDAALQLWLELGAPGVALAALAWTLVFAAIARLHARDRGLAAAATGAAVAYLVIGALSFGVWQEWWLALAAITAAVVTLVESAHPAGGPSGGLARLGATD